jgi:hypothetical protein
VKQAVIQSKINCHPDPEWSEGEESAFSFNCIITLSKAQKQILRCAQDDKH